MSDPETDVDYVENNKKKSIEFTLSENILLLEGVEQFGTRWNKIKEIYKIDRTTKELEQRYHMMKINSKKSDKDIYEANGIIPGSDV